MVKNFGLNRLSAYEISRLCKILDEKVEEFLKRPIEVKIRYLLVDATYFKVRCGAQYKNRALLVVVGVREDGLREILGASIAESEDSGYWMTLFRSLKDRGLEGVELVISDAHKGIQKQWNCLLWEPPGSIAVFTIQERSWRAFPTRTNKRSPIS